MSLKNVAPSLETIAKNLAKTLETREHLIKNTRGVVILCSRAIISVHGGDIAAAKQMIGKARKQIAQYKKKAPASLGGYLLVPEQELVEAISLVAIFENRSIPSARSCGVSGPAYILGLLDCIGELKRLVYDKIRVGDLKEATRVFDVMEELYERLYPFAVMDKVLKDARRKLDVDRVLIEGARAALTEEIRRQKLLDAIKKIR